MWTIDLVLHLLGFTSLLGWLSFLLVREGIKYINEKISGKRMVIVITLFFILCVVLVAVYCNYVFYKV